MGLVVVLVAQLDMGPQSDDIMIGLIRDESQTGTILFSAVLLSSQPERHARIDDHPLGQGLRDGKIQQPTASYPAHPLELVVIRSPLLQLYRHTGIEAVFVCVTHPQPPDRIKEKRTVLQGQDRERCKFVVIRTQILRAIACTKPQRIVELIQMSGYQGCFRLRCLGHCILCAPDGG